MIRPMFPLGSVLVPTAWLPLQIFEPRYQLLVSDLLDGGGRFVGEEFGVVLIWRGHEVGGGDQRTDVGTSAAIIAHRDLGGGRHAVVAEGRERFRVTRWLDDDPYPLAEIEPWPDVEPDRAAIDHVEPARNLLMRSLALASEAGHAVGPLPDISDDPALASMQILAAAPIGVADRQSLLEVASTRDRLITISEVLADAAKLFELEIRTE